MPSSTRLSTRPEALSRSCRSSNSTTTRWRRAAPMTRSVTSSPKCSSNASPASVASTAVGSGPLPSGEVVTAAAGGWSGRTRRRNRVGGRHSSPAEPWSTVAPAATAWAPSQRSRAVLPAPATPDTTTIAGWPSAAPRRRWRSSERSARRPTNAFWPGLGNGPPASTEVHDRVRGSRFLANPTSRCWRAGHERPVSRYATMPRRAMAGSSRRRARMRCRVGPRLPTGRLRSRPIVR